MGTEKSLKELADYTGALLQGENAGDIVISKVGALEQADSQTISFLANKKYRDQLKNTKAAAVILPPDTPYGRPCLWSKNPYLDFVKIVYLFAPREPSPPPGIHPTAYVDPEAVIHEGAAIGPLCVIGKGARVGQGTVLVAQVFVGEASTVGDDCRIYPGVIIREGISIGNHVIIHPGAAIGADGFGFAPDGEKYLKIPQIGKVVIEDDVEIGANTTIDRAALGETRIQRGAKLDNLIQVAHNVWIGEDTVVAAQAGISGSTKVGKHVMIAGQVGTQGHIHIGDNAVLGGQAGITRDVAAGVFVSGYPARPHQESLRLQAETARLPELRKRVADLESRLKELEKS
ncbi:UDP-3-O-(3-hydroxymyristoyl)glucosamine N-acyltransferase [candidate division FCPU426 bacterium]|nr:UDP-3-O-(3-hydroxymyristoyl)glucosamine N-acyltransferase [candidate division FCPU426 bacterium]